MYVKIYLPKNLIMTHKGLHFYSSTHSDTKGRERNENSLGIHVDTKHLILPSTGECGYTISHLLLSTHVSRDIERSTCLRGRCRGPRSPIFPFTQHLSVPRKPVTTKRGEGRGTAVQQSPKETGLCRPETLPFTRIGPTLVSSTHFDLSLSPYL